MAGTGAYSIGSKRDDEEDRVLKPKKHEPVLLSGCKDLVNVWSSLDKILTITIIRR